LTSSSGVPNTVSTAATQQGSPSGTVISDLSSVSNLINGSRGRGIDAKEEEVHNNVEDLIAKETVFDETGGDGGDSDEEGDEVDIHSSSQSEALAENKLNDDDGMSRDEGHDTKPSAMLKHTATGTTKFIGEVSVEDVLLVLSKVTMHTNSNFRHIQVITLRPQ